MEVLKHKINWSVHWGDNIGKFVDIILNSNIFILKISLLSLRVLSMKYSFFSRFLFFLFTIKFFRIAGRCLFPSLLMLASHVFILARCCCSSGLTLLHLATLSRIFYHIYYQRLALCMLSLLLNRINLAIRVDSYRMPNLQLMKMYMHNHKQKHRHQYPWDIPSQVTEIFLVQLYPTTKSDTPYL